MTYILELARRWPVLVNGQTYRNLAYLLATFPLGIFYFVALVVGFSLGFGLAIVGVGLLILVATFGFAWSMAIVERRLAVELLRVEIAPLTGPRLSPSSRWQQIRHHLLRPVTWKSMIYLILKFPLGIATFCIAVTLLALSLSLLFYPLGVALPQSKDSVDPYTPVHAIWQHVPQPWALMLVSTICVFVPALGLLTTVASAYALNAMAVGWGQLSRILLGMSTAEIQVAEARFTAVREQARAESADQRRRELIVNVSHELRTPIANIRGHVESLRLPLSERLSETDKDQYLAIVAREAERLGSLVDDLLALARADADELQLDVRPVAVDEVILEIHQSLAPLAERERQITVIRSITPDLPRAMADRERLAQVLLNLARNAITATPVGGLVFLDLESADEGYIALKVSDTGHGIPPEDLDRVFERFYRSDASRQRTTGGFGLGLSIVRDLVQAMGGTVSATSTVGVGSCFTVLLRVAGDAV